MIYDKDINGKYFSTYSDKEYHAKEDFVGSSTLRKICNGRSTDYLHLKTDRSVALEIGTAYHHLIQDFVSGEDNFNEYYFVSELDNRPSEALYVHDSNVLIYEAISKTSDGSVKKTKRNDALAEIISNGYRFPLKREEYFDLMEMKEGLCKLKYRDKNIIEYLGESLIEDPIFWENGIKKKCKPDFLFLDDDSEEVILFDLKTFGKEIEQFGRSYMLDGYWVQDAHYCEGVSTKYPMFKLSNMKFIVSSKSGSYISAVYYLPDDLPRVNMLEDYEELCFRYKSWLDNGRAKMGYIEDEIQLSYWRRNYE